MDWRAKFSELMVPPRTPECDKLAACKAEAHTIGEFLEWFQAKVNAIASDGCGGAEEATDYAGTTSIEKLLNDYFRINTQKLEQERRELLAYQRLLNAWSEERKELGLGEKS